VVVETVGAEGCYTATESDLFFTPAFEVEVVDTTGAGDVFHGAFLSALLEGLPMRRVVQYASAAAAASCTRLGGRAGCPSPSEVEALLSHGARRTRPDLPPAIAFNGDPW
jgi:sulfofructose kinase